MLNCVWARRTAPHGIMHPHNLSSSSPSLFTTGIFNEAGLSNATAEPVQRWYVLRNMIKVKAAWALGARQREFRPRLFVLSAYANPDFGNMLHEPLLQTSPYPRIVIRAWGTFECWGEALHAKITQRDHYRPSY